MDWMPQAVRDGVIVVLVISGPLVIAAAIIGLAIGILQAATQVQEQTIGSALKIIGVFALIIVLGFWMFQYLTQYTNKTLSAAFTFIPNQTQKVVPRGTPEENILRGDTSTKSPPQIPKLLQPEKLEADFGVGTPPPGAPALGRPEPPMPPPLKEVKIPESPKLPQAIPPPAPEPKLPLSDFQEPVGIPEPPIEELENEGLINYVPGNPIKINKEADIMLWHRKELISTLKESSENTQKEDLGWLN